MTSKGEPTALELGPQAPVVEDLTVEHGDVTTAGGNHRLMAFFRKIDDREPAMAEVQPGFGVFEISLVVRPPMREGPGHTTDGGAALFASELTARAPQTRDAAHYPTPPVW